MVKCRINFKLKGIENLPPQEEHKLSDFSRSPKGEQDIQEPSEIGEAMKVLNDDQLTSDNKMSSIDMKTRLAPVEISSILALDTLVALKVIPSKCLDFTRQKKRLAISMSGMGRKELVELATGIKEDEIKKSGGFNLNPTSWFKKQE